MDDRNPLGEPPPADEAQSNFNGFWPKPGAWRNLLGAEGEDFIRKMLAYGPLALGSRAGTGAGNSAVWANQVSKAGPPEYSGRLPTSDTLGSLYGDNMHTPSDLSAAFSAPTQPRASNTNTATGGVDPLSYYRALLDQKRGQFTVIPGDKP